MFVSTRRRSLGLTGIVAIAILLGVWATRTPSPGGPHLRTFPWDSGVFCNAGAAVPPLTGILEGNPADPELVWLRSPGRGRVSIAWPTGFSVAFEPGPVLYNERQVAVARAGDTVVLGQVGWGEHAGSPEDPYLARGHVFAGCYPSAG